MGNDDFKKKARHVDMNAGRAAASGAAAGSQTDEDESGEDEDGQSSGA